jgi:hypothetical protein
MYSSKKFVQISRTYKQDTFQTYFWLIRENEKFGKDINGKYFSEELTNLAFKS